MKLSFKTILPILLIFTLLILLTGCFITPSDEQPGYTPGTITGTIAAPCCSTSADPVTEPSCVYPEYWCCYCEDTWSLQDGVEVVLTYGVTEVATTTTNEDGEYTFTNVPPAKNYVITAFCPDYDDDRPLVKDVALKVEEGETFDTEITDCVSTALGLVVDYLVENTTVLGPEEIVLDGVIAGIPNFYGFPEFKKLVERICEIAPGCVDLFEDEKVPDYLCRAAQEIGRKVIPDLDLGCTPGYTPGPGPGPTPDPCVGNIAPVISSVLLDGTEVSIGETVHVVVGTPYVVTVNASDPDGILGTLTYSASVNGVNPGPFTLNQITITPLAVGSFTVYISVNDGCTTTSWGPVTVEVHEHEHTLILNVNPEGGGIVTGAGTFAHGFSAPISTTSNEGYQFTGWTVQLGYPGNVGNTATESTTVTMNEDMTLTANFVVDIFQGGTVSIAFEDLEIAESSDYDYNDWIVDLTINTTYDGDTPNLTSITFDILPKARGAGHDHRFHILIPADTFAENGSYNLVITGASGSDSGIYNSGNDMDFIVIPDTRASLGGETHNHTNTKEVEGPTAPTVTATLTIAFDKPFYYDFSQYDPYSADSMHGEGLFFDPYIEVDTGTNNQFDLANYEVHKEDPRILTVPDTWLWPEEGIAIWNVYESSVTAGSPPTFSPAWWTVSPNNCVYGDGIVCTP